MSLSDYRDSDDARSLDLYNASQVEPVTKPVETKGGMTAIEQESYDLLHYEGLAAFDQKFGGRTSAVFEDWERRGLVRQNWSTYGIKTFAKYATKR